MCYFFLSVESSTQVSTRMATLPLILAEASLTFRNPTSVDALLRGPQQIMLLRRLEMRVSSVRGSRALWDQVTSIVDGSLRDATPEQRQEAVAAALGPRMV